MTATVPTTEPSALVAGDTVTWRRTLTAYPAGTWTLKYRLINAAGKIDITASADGTAHLVAITSSASAAFAAGVYTWSAWVEKTGERHTVGNGTMIVQPNIAALNMLDGRTPAQKILDQLMAAYTGYTATNGMVAEYQIGERRMKYRSSAEILEQINHWKSVVAAEKRAERIASGLGGGNSIKVRF